MLDFFYVINIKLEITKQHEKGKRRREASGCGECMVEWEANFQEETQQ